MGPKIRPRLNDDADVMVYRIQSRGLEGDLLPELLEKCKKEQSLIEICTVKLAVQALTSVPITSM